MKRREFVGFVVASGAYVTLGGCTGSGEPAGEDPPAPTPDAEPEPAPDAEPEPAPEPDATPEPTPEPAPTPSPGDDVPFIGQVMMFAGNFAPRGWALCDGQLLDVSQYSALFSVLGTTYGGDGRTTFALPDLRGRVPMHAGQGPGLDSVALGAQGGSEDLAAAQAQSGTGVPVAKPGTNQQPFTTVNFIIALEGTYPSRG